LIKLDGLDPSGIVEISHGRIVKGQMSVFSNAQAHEVDWSLPQQRGIPGAFRRGIRCLSLDAVECGRLDAGEHVFALIRAEGRGMIGGEADVFIHVKDENAGPIDTGGDQCLEQFILRWCAGEDNACGASSRDKAPQVLSGTLCSRLSEADAIFGNEDLEVVKV
jgi:hypothetical protein